MVDAMELFPLPDDCNIFYLCYVKDVLVSQFGIDEGFKIYREQLSPKQSINRSRPQRIARKQVATVRDVAAANGVFFAEIHPSGETFVIPPARVVGEGDRHPLAGTARSSYVTCLSNARIHGRSPFLELDGSPALDYEHYELLETDDRWNVDHYVFHADRDVAYQIRYDQPIVELDEAFGSLLGTSTMSWGHWLGDYIPKYIFAVLSGHLPRVPVLIDAGMPETHRQALELVMPEGTHIVEISPESEVRVRRLWWAPSLGYAPLLPHFNAKFSWDKFCTVPARWTSILTEMGRAVDLLPHMEASTDRLYLGRKPYRWTKLLNAETIESVARSRGFTVVYPEDHALRELAQYVRNARYVVGPVGSQMVNAYFARPRTRVCYLTHPFLMGAWPYPLSAIDVDVTMVTGPARNLNDAPEPPTFGYPHHADYEIDPDRFAAFLDEWVAPGDRP
jgi:hypothetical protein